MDFFGGAWPSDLVAPWLRSLADAALAIGLLSLLLFLHAAEAALLGLPLTRLGPLPAADDRRVRLALWAERPQLVAWATIAWQSAASMSFLLWVAHLLGQATQAWSSLRATVALSFFCCGMLGFRLLGQLIGRVVGEPVAAAAMPLIAPVAHVLAMPFAGAMVLARRAGLAGPGEREFLVGPSKGAPTLSNGPFWTADTLAEVSHLSHRHGNERDLDLFASLTEFSGTIIREVMVPRTAMVAIALQSTEAEVVHAVRDAQHSRMPVFEDTVDHIVGLLHVKALFEQQQSGTPFDLKAMLRPTFYVPEVMRISALLQEFQRRKTHMAIVVDEYGGTSGIVTLEDIIEEIVGEIHDEYDVEEKQLRVLADGKVVADAKVSIDEVERALRHPLHRRGEFESLGGYLTAFLGHVPARGTSIDIDDLRFTIKDATERRIIAVDIERRRK